MLELIYPIGNMCNYISQIFKQPLAQSPVGSMNPVQLTGQRNWIYKSWIHIINTVFIRHG